MSRSDFSDLVKNPKMKLVLQDCGHLDSATLGRGYTLQVGVYKHRCTSGPSTWYRKAGISLRWWSNQKSATVEEMKRNLQAAGLVQVWAGTGQEANEKLNSSKYLRPGDIASMLSSDSAHGAMWTGEDWRSDCIQGTKPYPYSSAGRGGNQTFILWRHPSLQEPGLTVQGDGLGNPMDGGSYSGGEGSHEWPDFNIQSFPIMNDEHGQYTNEPLLLGIANHLRISGGGFGIDAGSGIVGDVIGNLEHLSVNCLAFTMNNEGWSDAKSPRYSGKIMTNAVAGCQSAIDSAGVITVGPGLTNYLNGNLPENLKIVNGKTFTPEMIAQIYKICHAGHVAAVKKFIPAISTFGTQGCWDACIDAAHSGHGHLQKYMGGATSIQDLANKVMSMPTSSKVAGTLRGLVERRIMEQAMILGKDPVGLSASGMTRWERYKNPPEEVRQFAALLARV